MIVKTAECTKCGHWCHLTFCCDVVTVTGLPADLKNQGNLIFFKVRELSGNFENWSVKNKNPQKSGKIQGKIILKDTFFSITSIGFGSLLALNNLNISLTSILL